MNNQAEFIPKYRMPDHWNKEVSVVQFAPERKVIFTASRAAQQTIVDLNSQLKAIIENHCTPESLFQEIEAIQIRIPKLLDQLYMFEAE